jgi:succinate dehydrogenase/fumarate reductase flavoprotein subunit
MTENRRPEGRNGETSLNTPKKGESTMSSGEKEQKRISRREFVKGAAVGAAGVAAAGALASCTPEVVKETVEVPVEVIKEVVVTKEVPVEVIKEVEAKSWLPDKWDMETDVLVVGSGHCGGLPAAIEAKKAGADVIIIEKEDHAGGLSLIGGDTFTMGGNNWLQQQEGVVDDDEVWFQDEMFSTGYRAVPEIIRTLIKRGPDTCLWLKSLGLEWRLTAGVLRSPIKRGFDLLPSPNYPGKETMADGRLKDGGMGFYTVMRREVDRLGIPVLLKHRMRSIYREPNGPVLGVKVDTPQGTINIKARKAVHLATGTWSDNYRMVQAWDPRAVGPDCYGDGGTPCDGTLFVDSAGDGHLAAAEIGAGFSDMSYVAYYYISYGSRS